MSDFQASADVVCPFLQVRGAAVEDGVHFFNKRNPTGLARCREFSFRRWLWGDILLRRHHQTASAARHRQMSPSRVRTTRSSSVSFAQAGLEPSGPEARARVFVHVLVLYEFRDY